MSIIKIFHVVRASGLRPADMFIPEVLLCVRCMGADSLYRDWRMKQILSPQKGKIDMRAMKMAFMDHFG